MKQQIITIIVALMAIATGAQAQHAYLNLKIAGVQVTQDNAHDLSTVIKNAGGSGRAYYSELNHELTLENVDLTCSSCCIESENNGIYINFYGNNWLTCTGNAPAIRLSHSTEAVFKGTGWVSLDSYKNAGLEINSVYPVRFEGVDLDIDGKTYGINGKDKGELTIKNSTVQVWSSGGQAVSDLATLSIQGSSDVTFYVSDYASAGVNYAMGGVQEFSLGEDMTFAQPSGGHFEDDSTCNIYTSSGQPWSDDIHFATTAIPINNTYFPDNIFRIYVDEKADTDGDNYLNKAERRNYTTIDVQGWGVGNLKGIEYFTSLETLNCSDNSLTSLYVPISVKTLDCHNNKLTSLDVSTNPVITTLDCSNNQLTSLTVFPTYGYNNLQTLNCSGNQLTSLYLGNLFYLTSLDCSNNKLTALEIPSSQALQNLNCSNNSISSLTFVVCGALSTLNCSHNNLSSLIISTCSVLKEWDCSYNSNLATIAMGTHSKLTSVKVNNTALGFTMQETIVDKLPSVSGTFYPRSNKISIKDVTRAKNKGWTVNTAGVEAYKISDTNNFPDTKFQSYLSSQSYGSDDGWIEASEISNISSMNVSGRSIQNLKGIEYFTYLNTLVAYDNLLTTIDLSKNTALQYLHIYNNDLSALNLSNNHELLYLDCSENNGNSSLNVTGCSKLYYLNAHINNLSSLDVTSCTALKNIYCTFNHLKSLNLSNNNKLENVSCSVNQLTSFLLPNTTTLKTIKCANNKLKDGGMWSTVYSLPYVESGDFYVTNDSDVNEGGNALTQEQLAIVMERGWTAYHQLDANNWKPYTLGAPTGVERIASDAADGAQRYNLQGQHVGTYYKGIVVKNGRKVLKK